MPLPGAKPSVPPATALPAPALEIDSQPEPLKITDKAVEKLEKKEVVPKKDSKKEAKAEKKGLSFSLFLHSPDLIHDTCLVSHVVLCS